MTITTALLAGWMDTGGTEIVVREGAKEGATKGTQKGAQEEEKKEKGGA